MSRFPEGALGLLGHRVADIVAALGQLTHYDLLEVDPSADRVEITRNYNLMVQAYREVMSYPECSDALYEDLVLLCQRLSEAAWVLCDPGRRPAYDGRVAQRQVRREESLHPITRRGDSGQLELEDGFELDGEPTIAEFTPLRHAHRPLVPGPEPALGASGREESGTQSDQQFTAETVGFGERRDTLVTHRRTAEEEADLPEEPTVVDPPMYGEEQTTPMEVPHAVVIGTRNDEER